MAIAAARPERLRETLVDNILSPHSAAGQFQDVRSEGVPLSLAHVLVYALKPFIPRFSRKSVTLLNWEAG